MKKVLSYILISLIISANLLAPISVGWSKNGVEVKKNEARAADDFDSTLSGYMNAFPKSSVFQTSSNYIDENSAGVDITVIIDTGVPENVSSLQNWLHVKPEAGKIENIINGLTWGAIGSSYDYFKKNEAFILLITENDTKKTGWIDVTNILISGTDLAKRSTTNGEKGMYNVIKNNKYFKSITPSNQDGISAFKPDTAYTVSLYYLSNNTYYSPKNENGGVSLLGLEKNGPSYYKIATNTIKTASKQIQTIGTVDQKGKEVVNGASGNTGMPACGIIPDPLSNASPMGCVAQGFYYILYQPTSYLFALTGKFFDYTFSYSVQDTSYRSSFVVQGWGLVRDFCNLFFIFIMLYIAIGTILNLHSVNTKETIINIVIIGLFINFSLLAAQVIIDASNITARVFYNSDAIKITEKGVTGATTVVSDVGPNGVIPLSAALVNKINPQNLIINSQEINSVQNGSTNGITGVDTAPTGGIGIGQFILIVLMASAVNIVGLTVFMSLGLIFLARVIGLWLAMIMAPLAFFTYILPSMSKTKHIGWENWWPETLKLAFLAPIFIFFMYIILKFLQMDLISDAAGKHGLDFFIATLIPLAFVMILMNKAKKLATDLSGEIGQQITSKLAMAGGLALGAATGGAAMLGRATLGRLGNSITSSDSIQQAASKKGIMGMGARMLLSGGKKAGSGSFDVRNTKAGSAFSKETGIDLSGKDTGLGGLVKVNQGGFVKARADKTAARQQRAKDLELSVDSKQKQALMKMQMEQKRLEDEFSVPIHDIENKLTAAKQRKSEAVTGSQADIDATKDIQDLNNQKAAYTKGGATRDANGNVTGYNTSNGNISASAVAAAAENLTKADAEFANATQVQTAAAQALGTTLANMNTAINGVAQAQADLLNAQNAATTAAAHAAANPTDNAAAINHTNALSIQAAAQTKLDKINSDVQTTTTAYNNALSSKQTADDKLTVAENNRFNARQDNNEALNAQAQAMAPGGGGLGKSINDLKFGDIPHAELHINKRNNMVKGQYAEYLGSGANKVANFFTSGGVHDFNGDFEAMYKIKMDAKIENSGGGASHSAPATHTPAPAPTPHTAPTGGGGGGAHAPHHP
ncbi:MAG: hypothetical protein WC241_03775 [Candidatus Paceibacterota bacterium]|jgi:hypothetical protein